MRGVAMSQTPTSLRGFCEDYADRADYSAGYREQLRFFLNAWERFADPDLPLDQIDEKLANSFLQDGKGELRDETRKSRRRILLTLLRAASDDGYRDPPNARKIFSIAVRDRFPTAWTLDEVRKLLAAAKTSPGYCGEIPAAKFWFAYILAAWDSGLRGCDLRRLERDWIAPNGCSLIIQVKTGKRIVCTFRRETVDAIDATFPPDRKLVFPLWTKLRQWRVHAKALVESAGLRGSIGKLRHSSGTAIESLYPSAGHLHLGNSRAVFESYYYDPTLAGPAKPLPPNLID